MHVYTQALALMIAVTLAAGWHELLQDAYNKLTDQVPCIIMTMTTWVCA